MQRRALYLHLWYQISIVIFIIKYVFTAYSYLFSVIDRCLYYFRIHLIKPDIVWLMIKLESHCLMKRRVCIICVLYLERLQLQVIYNLTCLREKKKSLAMLGLQTATSSTLRVCLVLPFWNFERESFHIWNIKHRLIT